MPTGMSKPNFKREQGITLVGVLVAAFIVATGVVAVSRLTARAQQFTGVGREITQASSLSREGLELVRAVRDSNWFKQNDRTHWLDSGICAATGQDFSENNRQLIIDAEMVRQIYSGNHQLGPGEAALYLQPSSHAWTHDASGQKTPYKRTISIDCSSKNNEPKLITVTSQVTWSSRGQDRQVTLSEKLYNWLPSNP